MKLIERIQMICILMLLICAESIVTLIPIIIVLGITTYITNAFEEEQQKRISTTRKSKNRYSR